MRSIITILFLVRSLGLVGSEFKEVNLATNIEEVTVFLSGAHITRNGQINISPGRSTLIIRSLSPHLDDKSIQVKATGNFTIVSVNHRLNYLNELKRSQTTDSLHHELDRINQRMTKQQSRKSVLHEKMSVLNTNKDLSSENSGPSLTQLKQALDFYDLQLTNIKEEEIQIDQEIQRLKDLVAKIQNQIYDVNQQIDLPTGEIEIRVESEASVSGEFEISYFVQNAGWYPKYDLRVESIEKPIQLHYKAELYQNTGVDWNEVKLKFSNGDPRQSGVAPVLNTWYLNYARNTIFRSGSHHSPNRGITTVSGRVIDSDLGDGLPGATVMVKGSTIGTVTDLDGKFELTLPNRAEYLVISYIGYTTQELPITSSEMNVPMSLDVTELEEVVVVGYAGGSHEDNFSRNYHAMPVKKAEVITTTAVENQTIVEFEVNRPYTVLSNAEKLMVDLKEYNIETNYKYYAIPKLDPDAFLIARISNWDQYGLLEGEANLFFEDAYVGRTVLDARSLADTLDISLGRDKSIVVARNKIDEYATFRTIGGNRSDSRGYKIYVRNKKSAAIDITVFDQLPVASISEISIQPKILSNGKFDDHTGEVSWELNLLPTEQKELILGYEVKYPKREKVYLE